MTDTVLTPSEIDALIRAKRQPAIALLRTAAVDDPGTPGCWFGGSPTLPADIDWPVYVHTDGTRIPMHFLVQINLAQLPQVDGLPALPTHGTLFVFFECAVAPVAVGVMGDEPTPMLLGTGAKVLYVDADIDGVPPRTAPAMPDLSHLADHEIAISYQGTNAFDRWPFDMVPVETYPAPGDALPEACEDRLFDLSDDRTALLDEHLAPASFAEREMEGGGLHTLFGASQQRYRPTSKMLAKMGYSKYPPLEDDHVLLLRISSDAEIGHDYIDSYPISFWIKKRDLEELEFNSVVVWKDL